MTPTSLLLIPPTAHHPTAAVSQGQKEGDGKVESRNAGTKCRFVPLWRARPHGVLIAYMTSSYTPRYLDL